MTVRVMTLVNGATSVPVHIGLFPLIEISLTGMNGICLESLLTFLRVTRLSGRTSMGRLVEVTYVFWSSFERRVGSTGKMDRQPK